MSWTAGGGDKRIVIARKTSLPAITTNAPQFNTLYAANSNFSLGAAVASGQVVYYGSGNSFTVTGLDANSDYYFTIIEADEGSMLSYASNEVSTFRLDGNSITTAAISAPTVGATSLSFSAIGQNSLTLGWTSGNGTSRLVIARKSSEISSNPTNNTSYSANPVFGSGTALGGGFVVYNGSGSSVNVTGLDPASTYYFSVIEYLTGTETITYASSLRTTSSTNTTSSSSSTDSDEDGVSDAEDEFPTDPFMALSTSYPAAGFGTLMFEDLWPGKGDYDFNDLVLDYRYTVISNGDGNVVEARYTFVTRAIGGGLQNGFAFQLDGIPANRIHSVSGAKTNGISYATIGSNGAESNQTNANILVLKNASELLARSSGFAYMNVEAEAPKVEADTTVVIVKLLHEGVSSTEEFTSIADFSPTIFNPYLIVGQERGKEIHLANRVPSALANVTYFGREDDNSAPLQGRYYKTRNELPWALNIVQSVPHVIEKVDFTEAYLKFVDWAISGGVNNADWYLNLPGNRNEAKIYSK